MNFLAHLFLSNNDPDLTHGNFIADFIKNKEVTEYTPAVQAGIRLHRQIDQYTDKHRIVRQSTHRLQPNHGKYSPVVIDILFDHLLAKNWSQFSNETLNHFAKKMYKLLNERMARMPKKLKKSLPIMIQGNWLVNYGNERGIKYTLERMDQRTKFPSNFVGAFADLQTDYELFEQEFLLFFPDILDFVKRQTKI